MRNGPETLAGGLLHSSEAVIGRVHKDGLDLVHQRAILWLSV